MLHGYGKLKMMIREVPLSNGQSGESFPAATAIRDVRAPHMTQRRRPWDYRHDRATGFSGRSIEGEHVAKQITGEDKPARSGRHSSEKRRGRVVLPARGPGVCVKGGEPATPHFLRILPSERRLWVGRTRPRHSRLASQCIWIGQLH